MELAVYSPCIATAITIFCDLSSCFKDCNNIAKYSVSDFDTDTLYFSSIINFIFVANLNSIEFVSIVPSKALCKFCFPFMRLNNELKCKPNAYKKRSLDTNFI